jgi:histidinol-phosphatase
VQKNLLSGNPLGIIITILGAIITGIASVLLHRVGINAIFPYGFLIACALLFSAGIQIRYYFGEFRVYIFALICSITVYFLATVTTGDILVLGGRIQGEKPWAGYLGWALIIGAFLIPFTASLLPQKWFQAENNNKNNDNQKQKIGDVELDFMHAVVEYTDQILLRALNSGDFGVEVKNDGTPVSKADKEVEKYIRAQIAQKFPDDLILGEEFETEGADLGADSAKRRWIIDPIDGTKNFIRGVPVFATLIALEELDAKTGVRKPTKSIVSAPALSTRWWASAKVGAWKLNSAVDKTPTRLATSQISGAENAFLSISSAGGWNNSAPKSAQFFKNLTREVKRTRGFGDFYSYMLLSEGGVDIATEPDLELYDVAALIPVVENAGGIFCAVDGKAWKNADGVKSARASANAELDKQLQEIYDSA